MSNDAKKLCEIDSSLAKQTFQSLYEGIVLEVPITTTADSDSESSDGEDDESDCEWETRIIVSVVFKEGSRGVKRGWYVRTDLACEAEECAHATQKHSSSDLGDDLDIKIARGSSKYPGLGTYIKLFNEKEKMRSAFDIDN